MFMRPLRRVIATAALAVLVLIGPAVGCSDDPGEDRIGDGEIIDEGD